MEAAAAFLVIVPFLAGILTCAFFGVIFGRRSVWPSATILMIAIAYGIFQWTRDCLGRSADGTSDPFICDAPLEAFSAIALVLIGLPVAWLMVAAAAIVIERILSDSPQDGSRGGRGHGR